MRDDKSTQLEELTQQSKQLHLSPFWTEVKALEVEEPVAAAVPFVWKFDEIKPVLDIASDLVPLEMAERRAVVFRNPAYRSRIATTPTLYAAYSQYNYQERADAHRHTANAARISIQGTGGYTTVEGVKYQLERGDLVLTPNWTWHDHGNDGAEPNTWFDILDVPLMVHLNGLFFDFKLFEHQDDGTIVQRSVQTPRSNESDETIPRLAHGLSSGRYDCSESRKYFYPWSATTESLLELKRREHDSDEHEYALRFVDPRSGGPLLQTIDFSAHLLEAGKATRRRRSSCSTVVLIMEGEGYSEIGEVRLEWGKNDVLCIPNWTWATHVNTSPDLDVMFYVMTDEPVYNFTEALRSESE